MKSLVGMAAAHDVEVILVTFAHNSLDRRSDKGWGNIQADEAVAYGIQRHNRIIKELEQNQFNPDHSRRQRNS
jgi:hypothetical protein